MQETRSEVKLYIYMARECDPCKCTANKLVRFGLVKPIYKVKKLPTNCIVLNPMSEEVLSIKDREVAIAHGIVAVDCSWKRVQEFFNEVRLRGVHRKLPKLIAANPVNFGNPHILSTAEALAASLFLLDFRLQAEKILSLFKWGPRFIEINKKVFEAISQS
ncbi:MAG: DUF367 family protein [Candidatus Nezhaarchaeota archaeon]|nr:DUF367 family protein [Candidatus Nezhaarchaeota archaeon]MCX8141852.1 DUF367 family protein [Candidatus Nezhaarchaeota archaeon]MDW8050367.1 DUF367 family protein [Nitrososphaerota archaeon]